MHVHYIFYILRYCKVICSIVLSLNFYLNIPNDVQYEVESYCYSSEVVITFIFLNSCNSCFHGSRIINKNVCNKIYEISKNEIITQN